MRMLSRFLTIAMLCMAAIILPLGVATLFMAFELGLVFDGMSTALMLCLYVAFSIYEMRESMRELQYEVEDAEQIECQETEE